MGGDRVSRRNIVIGQKVDPAKVERARELRRQMTNAERVLWRHLRANRLKGVHFRRQQVIKGFIVDFYCNAAGLVVEVDGEVHEAQGESDAERDQALNELGLHVLRVTNTEVEEDLTDVLSRIVSLLDRRRGPDRAPPH